MVQFVGKVIGTILGLITIALITRELGQLGYGYYTTIMGFIQFFGIMVDFGLTITTAQMLGQGKFSEERLFGNILSLRIVSSLIFLGAAPLISLLFPYPPFVKWAIALMGLSFFFITLTQVFLGFYQKHLQMVYVSVAEVGNRIFLLLAVIIAIALDYGLFGILTAVVLSNLFQLIILYIPARKFSRIKLAYNFSIWKAIFKQTWPIALSIAFTLVYLRADIIIMSIFRSPEEIGLYGAAYKVIDVLTTLPFMLSGIMLPLLARFWLRNDVARFKKLVQQGFDALTLLAWPLVIGTIFVGHDVMALIAGEEFREAGTLLQLLVIAIAFIFLNSIFSHAIIALEKQKQVIWAYALTAVGGLAAYLILIPEYGAMAAAIITVSTEAFISILIFFLYIKYSRIWPSFKRWIPAIVSSAAMALVLWISRDLHVVWQILLAFAVYPLTLIATGGLSKEFIRNMLTLRRMGD